MKKVMYTASILSVLCLIASIVAYESLGDSIYLTLAITAGTISYHLLIRLAVGHTVDAIMKNRANLSARWFTPKRFETKLYRALGVKHWKGRLPPYSPETFDISLHSYREIAMATCQAEIVHEIIAILSLLPILAIIPFGTPIVFVLTSVLPMLYDLCFVMIQRFNRPRLLRLSQLKDKEAMR